MNRRLLFLFASVTALIAGAWQMSNGVQLLGQASGGEMRFFSDEEADAGITLDANQQGIAFCKRSGVTGKIALHGTSFAYRSSNEEIINMLERAATIWDGDQYFSEASGKPSQPFTVIDDHFYYFQTGEDGAVEFRCVERSDNSQYGSGDSDSGNTKPTGGQNTGNGGTTGGATGGGNDGTSRGGTCEKRDCGPQPGLPNQQCPDGVHWSGPTGRCIADGDMCGWEIVECPDDGNSGPWFE